jgi:dienelactone hydrolase
MIRTLAHFGLVVSFLVCGCTQPVQLHLDSSGDKPVDITASLTTPSGRGPFPAVVLMHGCGGLAAARNIPDWVSWFNGHGYATLAVDSFTGRGWGGICTNRELVVPRGSQVRVADAKAAFDYLSQNPTIDSKRVVLMGFSHGALTALMAALERPSLSYAGFISLYPYCGGADFSRGLSAPTMILIGEKDDWTPASLCKEIASEAGGQIELHVYQSAYHAFDRTDGTFIVNGCCTGGGISQRHVGYDPDAYKQSRIDVERFLAGIKQ